MRASIDQLVGYHEQLRPHWIDDRSAGDAYFRGDIAAWK
jgi:hypothetical protein